MKTRLIFISGSADLTNVIVYINSSYAENKHILKNIVVLYSINKNIPDSLLKFTKQLFQTERSLTQFIYFDLSTAKDDFDDFLKKYNCIYYEELLIWRILGPIEKTIIKELKYNKLILIENGIATYIPPHLFSDREKKIIQAPAKVSLFWSPLGYLFHKPSYLGNTTLLIPDKQAYINICKRIASKINVSLNLNINQKIVFVIGTSFYRTKSISKEAEEILYQNVILKYLKLGYHVYWKPHPRSSMLFVDLKCDSFTTLFSSIPLELYLAYHHPISFRPIVTSIASSTLAMTQIYFNAEVKLIESHKIDTIERTLPHTKYIRDFYKEGVL